MFPVNFVTYVPGCTVYHFQIWPEAPQFSDTS